MERIRRQISEAGNATRVGALQRTLKREEQKLNAVENNPELAKEALIKIGEVYLQTREYNKARIVFRHAMKFAEEEQKKRLEVQIIISQAAQGLAEKAAKNFSDFRSKYPKDPMAQSVKFLIGNALLQQQRYEEAITAFDESLRDFPESPASAQIPKKKAEALMGLGRGDEAIQSFRDFIRDAESGKLKVDPLVIEDTKRILAISLYQQGKANPDQAGKIEEALKLLGDLATNSKTPAIRQESSFLVANFESERGNTEQAITAFKAFAEEFPDSPNASKASYRIATLLQKQGNLEEARSQFQKIIDTYGTDSLAQAAYGQLWRSYKKDDFEKMVEIQDALIAKFPTSARALASLYDRAKMQEKERRDLEGAAETYLNFAEKFSTLPDSADKQKFTPFAGFATVSAALIKQKLASKLGNYPQLDATQQSQWKQYVDESEKLLREAILKYPNSKAQGQALKKLTDLKLIKIGNKIQKTNDAVTELSQLAGEVNDESSKLQVMIAQAGLLNQVGQSSQALSIYEQAFSGIANPENIPWLEYDRFGTLLLENQRWDKAIDTYKKLQSFVTEKQKHALAAIAYGLGAAYQGKGDSSQAQKYFAELKEKFPWSPKLLDAQYGGAVADFEQGNYQKVIDALKDIIKSTKANTNAIKAKSMILLADSLIQMGDKGITTPETKSEKGETDIYDLASNYYNKAEALFGPAVPNIAAEALYLDVKLRKKQGKEKEAQRSLDHLLSADWPYANTPFGQKARKDF
ncbi:MAG: tetratricopeptide repeat protein [Verrucomicrobiota bacterium]